MEDAGETEEQDRTYVLIMPTRDEEDYLQQTLDCIAQQTVLPRELVIVDDGSKDRTGAIADEAAEKYPWIHVLHRVDRGERKVGPGVIEAFYAGYEALQRDDYIYICKIDADVTFAGDYFEQIMERMERQPRLGGASGKVFNPVNGGYSEEFIIDEMVAGQVHFWRRACWEQIGGFVREVMWDGIDFHRARMFGWTTRSFREAGLNVIHHRLMGSSHKGILHGRRRWGRGQWFMGTHPLYILASGVFRMRERPYLAGGLSIILGYFLAALRGVPRYDDLEFRRHLHAWQLKRLGLGFLAPKAVPRQVE
ncbi:MAG: glycosyltransferase family 2 protein [Candidatus Hydrogenedentes bacterium]|nr:glycosyltransferase family 2 protein [Candidatus Hydrogenedentota bacterium]